MFCKPWNLLESQLFMNLKKNESGAFEWHEFYLRERFQRKHEIQQQNQAFFE